MISSLSRLFIAVLIVGALTTVPLAAFQHPLGHHGVQTNKFWWNWFTRFLQKNGVSLDPDGAEEGVSLDPNGAKNGVSLDPSGATAPTPAACSLAPDDCASATRTENGVSLDPNGHR